MLTEYEAQQKQRYIERGIRRWKREYASMDAAGLDTYEAASKIKKWEARQADFLNQTGLRRQYEREQVVGFGSSQAKGAKSVASTAKGGIIKTAESNRQSGSKPRENYNGPEDSIVEDPGLGRLPNAICAATTRDKLQGYLLNSNHPVGKHKAHVMSSVLGYNYENWERLSDKIFDAVQTSPVTRVVETSFGTKYSVPMLITGEKGKRLVLNTVWQIDNGTVIPRLVTITFNKKTIEKVG